MITLNHIHPYTIAKRIVLTEGYNKIHCCFELYYENLWVMVYGEAYTERDKLLVKNLTAFVAQNNIETNIKLNEKEIIKHLEKKWQQQSQSQQS